MTNTPDAGAPPPPPTWNAQPPSDNALAPLGYGGFWLRVIAYLIDALLLAVPTSILGVLFGGSLAAGLSDYNHTTNFVSLALGWLYFAFMESSERGGTIGKMAVGLRVVTDQGQRLSFANATGRYFAKIISAILLLIGFIMVAFTERKRGLHDMMAGTLVIKV